ncbi:MAG: fused MFS/spermidine synthase, partial [Gammaproteobacteria bacterium]
RPPTAIVLLLFFGSGACALVYQVVWARMMTHVFGSTALAIGTVLAAFMAGMALGSWSIGRVADRVPDRLRLYAWLEFGIGIAALVCHLLLEQLPRLYPALYGIAGDVPAFLAVLRFFAAFLLVMGPTVLMGATLPVLSRYLVSGRELVGVSVGTLYAVNTSGAVAGALLAGFWLIGSFGIHVPVVAAALVNLLIGVGAWVLSRQMRLWMAGGAREQQETDDAPAPDPDVRGAATLRLVLAGLAISGFTSFAYEIYWTRALVFVLGNSTYALTTMLCAFLTGIALGGYLVRFAIRRFRDRVAVFGWIQFGLGVFSALALPLLFAFGNPGALGRHVTSVAGEAATLVLTSFGVSFLVMLVPATLIGATFPLVGQLAVRRLSETGGTVGRVYAVNTLGNVAGALAPGLFLLDWLGIQRGVVLMASLNIGLGLLVLALRSRGAESRPGRRLVVPVLLLVAVVVLAGAPVDFRFPSRGERPDDRTLYYREGPLATTQVYERPSTGDKSMSVDGIVIGGTGETHFKQLLLAHLPRLLRDDLRRELSVGLGSGILVGESARHPDLQSITAVEIEPGVVEGAAYFRTENDAVLDDPRLTVIGDDVASFLRTRAGEYDVITADEKTADEYASNGFSYSLDYYRLLLERLAPDGLVAQWVPGTLPPRQYRMILHTFATAFPHVQLWSFLPAHRLGPFNTILVGSPERIPVDLDSVRRRFAERRSALQALAPYGLTGAEDLLPHFVADGPVIRDAVGTAPLNTLAHPRYEFYYPWEYAKDRLRKAIDNQAFLLELKRRAHPRFVADLGVPRAEAERWRRTFAAEFRFLESFQRFLGRIPMEETVRLFDEALALAPWSESLRARIYAQYRYFTATLDDPLRRRMLERRVEALAPSDVVDPDRSPAGAQ